MMWEECKDLQEYIVGLRRDLHQIPEVGFDLPETQAYVTAELDKIGIPYVCSEKDSSIIATIEGGKAGKTVCLRADMDALPVTEATGLPFSSRHEAVCMPAAMIPILPCFWQPEKYSGHTVRKSPVRYVCYSRLLRSSPAVQKS